MHPYLNIAVKSVRAAGKVVVDAMLHPSFTDLTKKTTDVMVTNITRAYPEHNIITPENFENFMQPEITWIIDPLNGFSNFLRGFPFFAISIAVVDAGNVEHAVIYNPAHDELFAASKGNGAQLNNKKIRCSINNKLEESVLAVNLSLLSTRMNVSKELRESIDYRYIGCPALHLAFVAAGRLDGYCDYNLRPWDLAAGALLIREAGGYVTDFNGKLDVFGNGSVISANTKMHHKLLECFQ